MNGLEAVVGLKVGDYYCLDGAIKQVEKGIICYSFAKPERVMLIPNELPYFRCRVDHYECRHPENKLFIPNKEKILSNYKYFLKQRGLK
jgi:hypothetical protein